MSRSGSQRDAPKGAKGKEKGPHPARGPAAKHSPWQAPHQGSRQAGSSPGKRGQAGISMAVAGHTVGAVQHLAQAQHGGWSDHQDIAGVRDVSEALERARARGSVAGGKYPVMGAGGPEKGREREGSRGAAAGMALQRSVARRRGPAEMPPRKEGKEQRKRPPSGRPMSAHASLSSTRQVSEMVLRPDVFYRKSGDIMAPARELMDVHRVSRTRKLHFLEKALQGDPVALALFDENTSWDPESIKAYVGLSQRPGREV